MKRAYLVINKDTQIASYLTHRSILDIVDEKRTLTSLNLNNMPIVDVARLIIIFYQTDDEGLSFRAEMNALRNLLASAFFNTDSLTVILVNVDDPLTEDLVRSATRDSKLVGDKIEIIHHEGALMFSNVGEYIAGAAVGQQSSSSFKSVYIREADKEEKDRFDNVQGEDGIDTILPALTDMATLYRQRAHVEAISAGRNIREVAPRPEMVEDFTRVGVPKTKTYPIFVVAGEDFTRPERASKYLIDYTRIIGRRVLLVNTDNTVDFLSMLEDSVELPIQNVKVQSTPSAPIAVLNIRFNQLSYMFQFLGNILGIEEIIFNVGEEDYVQMCKFADQLSNNVSKVFIAHFHKKSVENFINKAIPATAIFLTFELFQEDFGLQSYKKELKRCIVGKFPTEEVDVIEFRDLATGARGDESDAED